MFDGSRMRGAIACIAVLVAIGMAGCAGGAGATQPPSAAPSIEPVTSPDQAIARVITIEPRLAGVQPFDTGLIGQSSSFTVERASGVAAFLVSVRVGWGDCESGCIDEHAWVFGVAPDGTVSVMSETGPPVPADAWPSPPGAGQTGIAGVALAGPVCPVEQNPPDPACAPRAVAGAIVVVRDGTGAEIARTVTDADGSFFAEVPAGDYLVEPQPVEGLMGTPATTTVTVVAGQATTVQLDYDTGIR
jgi:hypothetical protein